MNYRPALDGVRGFAVIFVILFHCKYLKIGWVGVQLFFVLSGYLITSILLDAKIKSSVKEYLKNFYTRRSLRIFPLYFMFVGILIIFSKYQRINQFEDNLPWLLTYTYNIKRMFIGEVGSAYYSHLWSLAIEEQFYLVWPLFIYFTDKRYLKNIFIFLILLAPFLRYLIVFAASGYNSNQLWLGSIVYNCTLTQVDAFSCGALLTLLNSQTINKLNKVFLPFTLITLSVVILIQFSQTSFDGIIDCYKLTGLLMPLPEYLVGNGLKHVWGYSVINIISMLFISYALSNTTKLWLSNKYIRYVGKISYGLYVFHLPLVVIFMNNNMQLSDVKYLILYWSILILVSMISYNFCETPFLKLKRKFE